MGISATSQSQLEYIDTFKNDLLEGFSRYLLYLRIAKYVDRIDETKDQIEPYLKNILILSSEINRVKAEWERLEPLIDGLIAVSNNDPNTIDPPDSSLVEPAKDLIFASIDARIDAMHTDLEILFEFFRNVYDTNFPPVNAKIQTAVSAFVDPQKLSVLTAIREEGYNIGLRTDPATGIEINLDDVIDSVEGRDTTTSIKNFMDANEINSLLDNMFSSVSFTPVQQTRDTFIGFAEDLIQDLQDLYDANAA